MRRLLGALLLLAIASQVNALPMNVCGNKWKRCIIGDAPTVFYARLDDGLFTNRYQEFDHSPRLYFAGYERYDCLTACNARYAVCRSDHRAMSDCEQEYQACVRLCNRG